MEKQSLSVLVVDDDPDVLKAVQLGLRSCGWTVATTVNPREAVERARTTHPDVILCDASMPNFSGAQVIEMLKNDPATSEIPIVLMTGFAESHMFSHVAWTGFLAKPFGPKALREAIESAAAHRVPPKIE